MPLLIDTETRTDALVAAVNEALVLHGPTGLTLRRIARISGVSTSSILHHLGSREHLLRVCAHRTGRTRLAELDYRAEAEGVFAFLPQSDLHVVESRAWLAWEELWRCEDSLGAIVVETRENELALLARVLDYRLARDDLDLAMAVIDGLATKVCQPTAPMSPGRARELLARHLGVPAPGPGECARPRYGEPW